MPEKKAIKDTKISVKSILFSEPNSGFAIFRAIPVNADGSEKQVSSDSGKDFTAKGYVGQIGRNDELVISGEWEKHPKFGMQVKVTKYNLPEIDSKKGVKSFLQSGFIKGIGPSLADRICNYFGDESYEVMDKEPDRLLEVSGIGNKKLGIIKESWKANRSKQKALTKFQEWGIGPVTVQKIFTAWGEDALEYVEKNPYKLAWEIDNVGFLIADKIALNSGVTKDAPERVQIAISYVLEETANKEGHCFLYREELIPRAEKLLWPNEGSDSKKREFISNAINELLNTSFLKEDNDRIYSTSFYLTERKLARNIGRINDTGEMRVYTDLDRMLDEYESTYNMKFDSIQRQAVKNSLENKFSIITGGPGTGKTTIINAVLELSKLTGVDVKKIGLVAPTGRAAKRLEENTGMESKTIHRYLKYNPSEGFGHDEHEKVEDKLVVCDESSMLDIFLANNLFRALPSDAKMILVGDIYQLPSVGAGNVFKDCINSGKISCTELKTIYRQNEDSSIIDNAHSIKNGQIKQIDLSNKSNDFFWKDISKMSEKMAPPEKGEALRNMILSCYENLLKKGYSMDDVQILSPMYKGPVGVGEINKAIQNKFNPLKPSDEEARIGFRVFRKNDKVMQLKNNYDKEVFNGDQGKVYEIDTDNNLIIVDFEGKKLEYPFLETDQLCLSYACTIHKSQGSEYPIAIVPVTSSHYVMLQRNLLYTAVTRAKDKCMMLGESKALGIAVRNNKQINRNTRLEELIKDGQNNEDKRFREKQQSFFDLSPA